MEDEFGAILERTLIGGGRRIARLVAEVHLEAVSRDPAVSRTELLRQVMKRLRRISMVVHLSALDDRQVRELTGDVYRETLRAISGASTPI
jgi:hypothetical protein